MREPISKVYNIDCVGYMKTLPDKFFDLAIVDPPYGDARTTNKLTTTPPTAEINPNGRDMVQKVQPYNRFGGRFNRYKPFSDGHTQEEATVKYGTIDWDVAPPQEYWDELFRVSKNQIIWGGNYFNLPPTRCFVIWRKLTISSNFTMAMAEYAWTSFNDNAKVFESAPQGTKKEPRIHACQKPITLYQFLLQQFAHEGDKIFDSHMGSQSSRIACYGMGYDFYGCEIDKNYFKPGCERFERLCKGLSGTNNKGVTLKQLSIFDIL